MRRSRLDVVLRLAQVEEKHRLERLGQARTRSARLEADLDTLQARGARARSDTTPAPGQRFDPASDAANWRHVRHLEQRVRDTTRELEGARGVEEIARGEVAQQRLKVRAIENALRKRAQREAIERRRREARRIEELGRGLQEARRAEALNSDREVHDA